MTKTCSKCKRELPLTEFYKGRGRDGLRFQCKDCLRIYGKEKAFKYRRLGLCVKCGEKRMDGDNWYCEKHRTLYKKNINKYRARKKRVGECRYCKNKSVDGLIYCEEHRQMENKYNVKQYHNRRARGLCGAAGCGEKVNDGHSYCKECRDQFNRVSREESQKRKKEGRCISCGEEVKIGCVQCEGCLERQRDYYQKHITQRRADNHNRYKKLASENKCVWCGVSLELGSYRGRGVSCEKCGWKNLMRTSKKYMEKKQAGICVESKCCNPVVPGSVHCEECLRSMRQKNLERYYKRKVSGLCVGCGEPFCNPEGGLMCYACTEKHRHIAANKGYLSQRRIYAFNKKNSTA